jgi:hypothetical protein
MEKQKLGYEKFIAWFKSQIAIYGDSGWTASLRDIRSELYRTMSVAITKARISQYLADAVFRGEVMRVPAVHPKNRLSVFNYRRR